MSDKDNPSRKFLPQVKNDLHDNTAELVFQHRFYVSLPREKVHRNHLKGAVNRYMLYKLIYGMFRSPESLR